MKFVIALLCIAAVAVGAWLFGHPVDATSNIVIEWLVAALAVGVAFARWRVVARRRQRQKLQELRDSALW